MKLNKVIVFTGFLLGAFTPLCHGQGTIWDKIAGGTTGPSGTSGPSTNAITSVQGQKTGDIVITPQSINALPTAGGNMSGPLKVPIVNTKLYVDGMPPNGTVAGSNYTTQASYAFAYAANLASTSNTDVTLVFGSNYYPVCEPFVEPTAAFRVVNIEGAGIHASHIIETCSNPTLPILTKAEPANYGFGWMHVKDVAFHANGNANSCMDVWGLANPDFENIDCDGVIPGSDHFYQFGERGTAQNVGANAAKGGVLDGVFNNLFADSPFGWPSTTAKFTATVAGGVVTGLTQTQAGAGYNPTYSTVVFRGYNNSDQPCTTMPTATVAVTGGVPALTLTSGGAGCGATVDVQVYPLVNIKYGFDINASDSVFNNLFPAAGAVAGVNNVYGNNKFVGMHPTNIPVGAIDQGNSTWLGTECDTFQSYCIDFQSNLGTAVIGTNSYTGLTQPGSATYHFGPTAANISFAASGNLCRAGLPNDYHEFVSPTGPWEQGGTIPTGIDVWGNDPQCGIGGNLTTQKLYASNFTVSALKPATSGSNQGSALTLTGHTYSGGASVNDSWTVTAANGGYTISYSGPSVLPFFNFAPGIGVNVNGNLAVTGAIYGPGSGTGQFQVGATGQIGVGQSKFAFLPSHTVGTAIASAATIVPTQTITHVTGTATISNITLPVTFNNTTGGNFVLIPDTGAAFTVNTNGNIGNAFTPLPGVPVIATYDGTKFWLH